MVIFVGKSPPDFWQFRLGSIYFNTSNQPDDDGCLWTMAEPDGWESPTVRLNPIDIPFADGQDLGDIYLQARTIHATGAILSVLPGQEGAAAIDRAKSRLLKETRLLRQDGPFIGQDSTGQWQAQCRRADRTSFPDRPGPEITTFDFVLIAGDPYKYAVHPTVVQVESVTPDTGGIAFPWTFPISFSLDADVQAATAMSVNDGDCDAPMVITFVGPLTNPKLIDRQTGNRVELNLTIPDTRKVVVDTKLWTVMEDVTPVTGALSARTTPLDQMVVPAEGSCAWVLIGQGSGHVLVTHSDCKE